MIRVPKREAELKAAFTKELHRQLPGFISLLQATAGAPDRSITGAGRTTHWEFKHATPTFDSPGLQELLCMRLAHAGYCRYVFWWEGATGIGQRTMIVTPKNVHERQNWLLVPEEVTPGFDHRWLVKFIGQVHGV